MKPGIKVVEWFGQGRGTEAARLVPRHTVCATVDWPLPPAESADAVRPDVIAALSCALATCGSVAFRHDTPVVGAVTHEPPPTRSIKDRLLDLAGLGDDTFGLAIAPDPAAVSALFAYGGWSYAAQAALVFDPAVDPTPILQALREGLDWRGRALPEGARLLFGPGHDGDFAVIAASNRLWIEKFEAALT